MKFGFDAKRYFHNNTGLGNYSRSLVQALAAGFPGHQYLLFNPKPDGHLKPPLAANMEEVQPKQWLHQQFPSLWRSNFVTTDLKKMGVDLYHGLSHEIPVGIGKAGIRSVVTVHDLIFERYPSQYGMFDVRMHRHKIKYACQHADKVIAISRQTADDLVQLYQVPASRIEVCYQSCDPEFGQVQPAARCAQVRVAYQLPERFFLYVGSIIGRKNLLGICAALKAMPAAARLPLVVVGSGKKYKQQVQHYLRAEGLSSYVHFLNDQPGVPPEADLRNVANLAALYQMSVGLVYPSFFEGFGIPILEALWSRVPVITSGVSCMPETGGDAALYVAPNDTKALAEAMQQVATNAALGQEMVQRGLAHAQRFTPGACAASVMEVYQQVLKHGSI